MTTDSQALSRQDAGQAPTEPDPAPVARTFDAAYVSELRSEAAGWRTRYRELEQQLASAETAKLEEQARYKELAETYKRELDALQRVRVQHETLLASMSEANAQRVERIPERLRSLVPPIDDPVQLSRWLDANAALLTGPTAPNLNSGSGAPESPRKPALTEAQLRIAAKLGVDPEVYAQAP